MRYPKSTPYLGPAANYDAQIEPEQLLRRLAYGKAAPMLAPYKRVDDRFFARLIDGLSNSHVVLVKCLATQRGAYRCAADIRPELPPERFGIYVDFDPEHKDWNVLVFNKVTPEMKAAAPVREGRDIWVGPKEVARVLRITQNHAAVVMDRSGLPVRRVGGNRRRQIRQSDLVVLANRPGQWRRRTRKA